MTGTSHLLMNEYPLIVLPGLAAKIGLNEAIILQQIHWWTSKGKNIRDGRSWVYNTYADWMVQFPFWSEKTIKRTVSNLEKAGLILSTSQYNSMQIDKTKWYAVDYEKLNLMSRPSGHFDPSIGSNWPHPSGQNDLTNNHRTPKTTSKREPLSRKHDASVLEIIEYLNLKAEKQFLPNTKETVRLIQGRLNEGRTIDDFKHVIDVKVSQWKNDEKMDSCLRPSTLFRPSNFEAYLQERIKDKSAKPAARREPLPFEPDYRDLPQPPEMI